MTKAGKVTVNRYWKGKVEKTESDNIDVPCYEGQHATVSYGMDMTQQIMQYEPLSVKVFVSLPCAPDEDDIHAALEVAKEICHEKLAEAKRDIDKIKKVK